MTALARHPDLALRNQRMLLAAAGVTAAVEVASLAGLLPNIPIGGLHLSASLLPALALVAVLGGRLMGHTDDVHAEIVFWAAALLGLLAVSSQFAKLGQGATVAAVLGASLDEELVYRLAIPLVLTAALTGWGLSGHRARIVGFVVAGGWFVLLPGHRAQIGDVAQALPFLAFATLAALVVYRSGSVLAVVAIHACTDLFNLLALQHRLGPVPRSAGLGALFILLVMAYGLSHPRLAGSTTAVAGPRSRCRPPAPRRRRAWPTMSR